MVAFESFIWIAGARFHATASSPARQRDGRNDGGEL